MPEPIQIPDEEITAGFESLAPHELDVATESVQDMMDFVKGFTEEEPLPEGTPAQQPQRTEIPQNLSTLIPEEFIKNGKIEGKYNLDREGIAAALRAKRDLEIRFSRGEHKLRDDDGTPSKQIPRTERPSLSGSPTLNVTEYKLDLATRQTLLQNKDFREYMEDVQLTKVPETQEEWRQLRREDPTIWKHTKEHYDAIRNDMIEGLQEIETFASSASQEIDNVLDPDLDAIYGKFDKYFTETTDMDNFKTELKADWKEFEARKNDPSLWMSKFPGQERNLIQRGIDPYVPIPGAFARFVESKHITEIIERANQLERLRIEEAMRKEFETRSKTQTQFDKSFSQIKAGYQGIEARLPDLADWTNPDWMDKMAEEKPDQLATYIQRVGELAKVDPDLARKYQKGIY